MNVAAVAIVSIFAGIFLVALIGGMATLIVLHLRAQKANKELLSKFVEFGDALTLTLKAHRDEITGIIEPAKASFSGIRQDIKAAQQAQDKLLAAALKAHDQGFREVMGKINPAAMEASSVRLLNATGKIVQVASTLQALLVTHEVPEGAQDLAPEQYGPSDTIYSTVSEQSRLDLADTRAEVEANAPLFSGAE